MMRCLPLLILAALSPQDGGAKGLAAWDTGKSSSTPIDPAARAGWTAVAEGAAFKGDAVVSNGRVSVVFRRESGAVEMGRVKFSLAGASRLVRASLVESTKTAATIEATYKTDKGEATAKVRL